MFPCIILKIHTTSERVVFPERHEYVSGYVHMDVDFIQMCRQSGKKIVQMCMWTCLHVRHLKIFPLSIYVLEVKVDRCLCKISDCQSSCVSMSMGRYGKVDTFLHMPCRVKGVYTLQTHIHFMPV